MTDLMSIGRFSQSTGLTVKALRLYDRLHLLRPALVDFASGYRYYSPAQMQTAIAIRLLRETDMPLSDIHALLRSECRNEIEAQLQAHRRRIEARIGEYERALARLPSTDDWCIFIGKADKVTQNTDAIQCSFCGKPRADVRRIIAGPNDVFICNECVALCNRIIEDTEREESKAGATDS